MRISIVGSRITGWELILENEMEPLCVVENATYDEALDAFAASFPEHAAALDELNCDDLCGVEVKKTVRQRRNGGERKRGSGARFRELMMLGKSNEECLKIVRAEFLDSKATLSDAAWNRAALRKNPSGFKPDGSKV